MPSLLEHFVEHTYNKDVYMELTPENKVTRMAVADLGSINRGDLQEFVSKCARKAMSLPTIPNNIVIHYENIPPDEIPATAYFHSRGEELLHRFIVKNGINDYNTISLRKAAFLDFHQEPITFESLRDVVQREVYHQFVAHENARERILEGKSAKMPLTIAETNLGIIAFNDSLYGSRARSNYLQHMADTFFGAGCEGMEYMHIYRIDTSSKGLINLADRAVSVSEDGIASYNFQTTMIPEINLLSAYRPIISFDMRPTPENFDRYVTHSPVSLSAENRTILDLAQIARDGYFSTLLDEKFPYANRFSGIHKALTRISIRQDKKEAIKQEYGKIHDEARSIARQILYKEIKIRTLPSTDELVLRILRSSKKSQEDPSSSDKKTTVKPKIKRSRKSNSLK